MSTESWPIVARWRERGLSLIELVMAMVVLAVGVVGLLGVINLTTRRSADPVIQQQAQLIAESYLEEILLKRFVDPTADRVCPAPPGGGRSAYDNVCDYQGLNDNPPRDQFGNAIAALTGYTVSVTVTPNQGNPNGAVNLGPLANDYAGGYIRLLRVDVTVNGPAGTAVTLTGYRTNYRCNATIAANQCRPLT
jgi:MSHA pilin protein MshD